MRLNRADRSLVSDWWFTIDRLMLSAIVLLLVGGLVLSLAASPSVAERLGYDSYHFFHRHAAALLPALAVLFFCSMGDARLVRRASLVIFVVSAAMMVAALFFGPETKGATRWLRLGPFSLQPSEFAKPTFVVLTAWCLSESKRRDDMPSLHLAIAIYLLFVVLLVLQPDFGQAFLATLVWGGLFFMAGLPLFWVGALGAGMLVALVIAYVTVPHVAERIDSFLGLSDQASYQMQRAMESFTSGGWLGEGPGEGTVKQLLPDSHSDFVFAVVAEEFGLVTCLIVAALFAFVVLRGLTRVMGETDRFIRYAVTGLLMLFGFQALINMAVNVGLLPAKGMTLPFLSYGGSSLLSMAMTMGFVLGLSRRRPLTGTQLVRSRSGTAREIET